MTNELQQLLRDCFVTLWEHVKFMNEELVITWPQRNVVWRHEHVSRAHKWFVYNKRCLHVHDLKILSKTTSYYKKLHYTSKLWQREGKIEEILACRIHNPAYSFYRGVATVLHVQTIDAFIMTSQCKKECYSNNCTLVRATPSLWKHAILML